MRDREMREELSELKKEMRRLDLIYGAFPGYYPDALKNPLITHRVRDMERRVEDFEKKLALLLEHLQVDIKWQEARFVLSVKE